MNSARKASTSASKVSCAHSNRQRWHVREDACEVASAKWSRSDNRTDGRVGFGDLGMGRPACQASIERRCRAAHRTAGAGRSEGWVVYKTGKRFCTGGVLDSPAGDLILTAGHCVAAGQNETFVAGLTDAAAPKDFWRIDRDLP